jgi:hypothetical protein
MIQRKSIGGEDVAAQGCAVFDLSMTQHHAVDSRRMFNVRRGIQPWELAPTYRP